MVQSDSRDTLGSGSCGRWSVWANIAHFILSVVVVFEVEVSVFGLARSRRNRVVAHLR